MPTCFPTDLVRQIANDDGIALMVRDLDGMVHVIAKVPWLPDRDRSWQWANLLASAPALLHAILDLVEDAQPDGWDPRTLEGEAWTEAFATIGVALSDEPNPG